MNWQKLFEIQAGLDKRIIESKGLQGQDLLDKKILALQVELGELANEARFFKFWSENQEARTYGLKLGKTPRENRYINPLLEEYVDCLHFILSIGNDIDFTQYHLIGTANRQENITDMFAEVFSEVATLFRSNKQKNLTANGTKVMIIHYSVVLEALLDLGEMLGFTEEQIEQAYLDKNKVNHERQNNGY